MKFRRQVERSVACTWFLREKKLMVLFDGFESGFHFPRTLIYYCMPS